MAKDFLCIPGSSVGVERLFSMAWRLCQENRASLKADTVRVSMLVKAWNPWIREGLFDFY